MQVMDLFQTIPVHLFLHSYWQWEISVLIQDDGADEIKEAAPKPGDEQQWRCSTAN
jgi:hypothetical protein